MGVGTWETFNWADVCMFVRHTKIHLHGVGRRLIGRMCICSSVTPKFIYMGLGDVYWMNVRMFVRHTNIYLYGGWMTFNWMNVCMFVRHTKIHLHGVGKCLIGYIYIRPSHQNSFTWELENV